MEKVVIVKSAIRAFLKELPFHLMVIDIEHDLEAPNDLMEVRATSPKWSSITQGVFTTPTKSKHAPPLITEKGENVFIVLARTRFHNGLNLGFAVEELEYTRRNQYSGLAHIRFETQVSREYWQPGGVHTMPLIVTLRGYLMR